MALLLRVNHGTAAMGFCSDFVKSYATVSKCMTGEGLDCSDYSAFVETTLKPLLQELESNDIYNTDETSFFYKMLANHRYNFQEEKVCGSKHLGSKDRLSLMLCTNMTGTDKLPPMITGKDARPTFTEKEMCNSVSALKS